MINYTPHVITRHRLMTVMDNNVGVAGIKITVRTYNKILTDLGFRLLGRDLKYCRVEELRNVLKLLSNEGISSEGDQPDPRKDGYVGRFK